GTAVLLTTQYLDEVDRLANDIVVIDQGRVIAAGTSNELKARTGSQILEVGSVLPSMRPRLERVLGDLVGTTPQEDPATHLFTVPVTDPALLPEAVRRLDDAGVAIASLALRMPSLDEVFLQLTGGRVDIAQQAAPPEANVPQEVSA
ncbi:MAG: DUF4162 domain-containing protein, partial [Candidatus Dormibacteraceae bacterium]